MRKAYWKLIDSIFYPMSRVITTLLARFTGNSVEVALADWDRALGRKTIKAEDMHEVLGQRKLGHHDVV